jgi:hypothetical protein
MAPPRIRLLPWGLWTQPLSLQSAQQPAAASPQSVGSRSRRHRDRSRSLAPRGPVEQAPPPKVSALRISTRASASVTTPAHRRRGPTSHRARMDSSARRCALSPSSSRKVADNFPAAQLAHSATHNNSPTGHSLSHQPAGQSNSLLRCTTDGEQQRSLAEKLQRCPSPLPEVTTCSRRAPCAASSCCSSSRARRRLFFFRCAAPENSPASPDAYIPPMPRWWCTARLARGPAPEQLRAVRRGGRLPVCAHASASHHTCSCDLDARTTTACPWEGRSCAPRSRSCPGAAPCLAACGRLGLETGRAERLRRDCRAVLW